VQFLCASYAADLADLDAAKHRRLVSSSWYRDRYGDEFTLLADENRTDRFTNTRGGYRTTISVGSKTTGLGGDIKILDDPHNATDVEKEAARKSAVNWHDNAWRSRNNDPNTVRHVYVGQRTHDGDIFGHVLQKQAARWEVLMLPMEADLGRKCITYFNDGTGKKDSRSKEPIFEDPRTVPNALLCPERYGPDEAAIDKDELPTRTWNAQYQQQPEGAGGIILKRQWWRKWQSLALQHRQNLRDVFGLRHRHVE
jgi:hypothetical protein